jgi:hypothetical protein
MSILVLIIIGQIIIIEVGGDVFKTTSLTGAQWGINIALGATSIPIGWLCRLIPYKVKMIYPSHELQLLHLSRHNYSLVASSYKRVSVFIIHTPFYTVSHLVPTDTPTFVIIFITILLIPSDTYSCHSV